MRVEYLCKQIKKCIYEFSLLREEFRKAYGVFQQDGLAMAANYSVLNFQAPNREWKKVDIIYQNI